MKKITPFLLAILPYLAAHSQEEGHKTRPDQKLVVNDTKAISSWTAKLTKTECTEAVNYAFSELESLAEHMTGKLLATEPANGVYGQIPKWIVLLDNAKHGICTYTRYENKNQTVSYSTAYKGIFVTLKVADASQSINGTDANVIGVHVWGSKEDFTVFKKGSYVIDWQKITDYPDRPRQSTQRFEPARYCDVQKELMAKYDPVLKKAESIAEKIFEAHTKKNQPNQL
jgi:hypothetical protein